MNLDSTRYSPAEFMGICSICPFIFNNSAIKKDQDTICIHQDFIEF
jgi:hypothetical protein